MEYHKINSVFKRDQDKKARLILWDWAMPEFEYLRNTQWVGTEKIDGTNIRIYKDGRIGGRTAKAEIPGFLMPFLEAVRDRLVASGLPEGTILYGEGYGAKIQSGGHYIPDGNSFCLFDVNIAGNYQPRKSVLDVADKLGLFTAPLLGVYTLPEWVDAIMTGKFKESILHPGARNEGVVLRPEVELQTRCGERVITKLKFKDFS